MEINNILKDIREKYSNNKKFKNEFDKNKNEAIRKYFGKNVLKLLKSNLSDKISSLDIKMFLNKNQELDETSLENIAGGKDKQESKPQVVEIVVPTTYQKNNFGLLLNNAKTGGDFKIEDNTQIFKI